MAIKGFSLGKADYIGLDTDTKPTKLAPAGATPPDNGSIFVECDATEGTATAYIYFEGAWYLTTNITVILS